MPVFFQRRIAAAEEHDVVERDPVRSDEIGNIVLRGDVRHLAEADEIERAAVQQRRARTVLRVREIFGVERIPVAVYVVFEFDHIIHERFVFPARIFIKSGVVGGSHFPEARTQSGNVPFSILAEHDVRPQNDGQSGVRGGKNLFARVAQNAVRHYVQRKGNGNIPPKDSFPDQDTDTVTVPVPSARSETPASVTASDATDGSETENSRSESSRTAIRNSSQMLPQG